MTDDLFDLIVFLLLSWEWSGSDQEWKKWRRKMVVEEEEEQEEEEVVEKRGRGR